MQESKQDIEIDLLIDAMRRVYGYDYSQYQRASLNRRIIQFSNANKFEHVSGLIAEVIHDKKTFQKLLCNISVTVTGMFRDPLIYKAIVEKVFTHLRTYPYLNVWNTGCATGEEAYSIAILLKEHDLLKRSQVYATDINNESINTGKSGVYSLKNMKSFSKNYISSGGLLSLSDYFEPHKRGVRMLAALRKKIAFAQHNLAIDGVFAEMHIIFCKNVLIYFNKELQNKVLKLLTASLCNNGFLCLGDKESLAFTEVEDQYILFDREAKIYQKKSSFSTKI